MTPFRGGRRLLHSLPNLYSTCQGPSLVLEIRSRVYLLVLVADNFGDLAGTHGFWRKPFAVSFRHRRKPKT